MQVGGGNEEHNLFRSEQMTYLQLCISRDAAQATIHELGRAGLVQFVDLNPNLSPFQRQFASDVKRCDEMSRKLRVLKELVIKEGLGATLLEMEKNQSTSTLTFGDLEQHLGDLETSLQRTSADIDSLTLALGRYVEHLHVITRCEEMLSLVPTTVNASAVSRSASTVSPSLPIVSAANHTTDNDLGQVHTITGTVPTESANALSRILFRVSRGNSVIRFADSETIQIETGIPGRTKAIQRRVFCIFFYSNSLRDRISKLTASLNCSVFPFPPQLERSAKCVELGQAVTETKSVLEHSHNDCKHDLLDVAQNYWGWLQQIEREKFVFHTMNLFHSEQRSMCVIGECWSASRNVSLVQNALQRGSLNSGTNVPSICTEAKTSSKPPTYFVTNKLTVGFQTIVDAYGIANYQEINPTPFTVITFPFLFAVMFGDVGHGLLLVFFSLFMIARENHFLKNPPGEIFGICFGGRYVVLLMSLFSVYTGLLYNDTFSISVNLFDSKYALENENGTVSHSGTYSFGIDPVWKQADNELTFTNSLKMKMSIVFGVVQMLSGVLLSSLNHWKFRDWISLINVFIPQFIFMSSIFGYMVFLIFVKWGTKYTNTHCSPSILTTFIDMFLSMGKVNEADVGCGPGQLFEGQQTLQQVLLVFAVLSVPWMLLAKPLLERSKHNKHKKRTATQGSRIPTVGVLDVEAAIEMQRVDGQPSGPVEHHAHNHHHGEYNFGEEMVHQVIHTIEYVLGAVSNTASYLRLWALSLAHSQLSTVFWEKALIDMIKANSPIMLVVGYFVWLMATVGVLLVMEGLSAFLHALRLHWVEFQNKFYSGTGVAFVPFRFAK